MKDNKHYTSHKLSTFVQRKLLYMYVGNRFGLLQNSESDHPILSCLALVEHYLNMGLHKYKQ